MMNRLLFSLLLIVSTQQAFSQNYIYLSNKSRIEIDRIHHFDTLIVTFSSLGKLHDVEIRQVSYIRLGDTLMYFEKNTSPVYHYDRIPAVTAPANPDTAKIPDVSPVAKDKPTESVEGDGRNPARPEPFRPDVNIVFFPLALIEPDLALRVGTELQINDNTSLQADLAYIFRSWETLFDNNPAPVGLAARLEYRTYSKSNSRKSRYYLAPQAMFKYKNLPGNLAINNDETKYIGGLNLKLGVVSNTEKPFYMDFYTGFGVRVDNGRSAVFSTDQPRFLPNIMLGFSTGFRLNRFK